MNIRRLAAIAALLGCCAIVAFLVLLWQWQESQPDFRNAPNLVAAAQAYSRDRAARGQPSSSPVSLNDLLKGGYVGTNDVRMFDGMDVTVWLTADEAFPQSKLVQVRMADGSKIALLADGSVQQLP